MREKSSFLFPLIAGVVVLTVIFQLMPGSLWNNYLEERSAASGRLDRMTGAPSADTNAAEEPPAAATDDAHVKSPEELEAEKLLAELEKGLKSKEALENEALLTFKDKEAYEAFLKRAAAAGLTVVDKIDGLLSARVKFDSLDALRKDVAANSGDYANASANYYVYTPTLPKAEERDAQQEVGFGDSTLASMGIPEGHTTWGRDKLIAILDSGVIRHDTFGNRVRYLDVGQGTTGTVDEGHGTAVASLAAGSADGTMGVAPGANLLSIRVTGSDGLSDTSTLSKAIIAAVDAGAAVINISLGSYETNSLMSKAITYAYERGVPIVAAGGNDQAGQLTWPAADSRTVSVGAIDAAGQVATFSNAGEQLKLTAPGVDVASAWPDSASSSARVSFAGTSASAPLVAGGIAALMSQNPGMTGFQAAEQLYTFADEGGAPGADRYYGSGMINFAGIVNQINPAYSDIAVASHYLDKTTGQMVFVVQNRGSQAVNGLKLETWVDNAGAVTSLPQISPHGIFAVSVPLDANVLQQAGSMQFRSRVQSPAGFTDAVPTNNGRLSTVSVAR